MRRARCPCAALQPPAAKLRAVGRQNERGLKDARIPWGHLVLGAKYGERRPKYGRAMGGFLLELAPRRVQRQARPLAAPWPLRRAQVMDSVTSNRLKRRNRCQPEGQQRGGCVVPPVPPPVPLRPYFLPGGFKPLPASSPPFYRLFLALEIPPGLSQRAYPCLLPCWRPSSSHHLPTAVPVCLSTVLRSSRSIMTRAALY